MGLRWKFVKLKRATIDAMNSDARTKAVSSSCSGFGSRGVRVRVSGRQVPSYLIRRHKGNWGWIMESCWVVWSSWPMPTKDSSDAPELDDERLPVTFELQEAQAYGFNAGFEDLDSEDD